MTYLNYVSFGYYQLRWPLIIGFIIAALTVLFADHKENIMVVFSFLCCGYLGYQYTAQAPKYRYAANILLSLLVFSSIALFMHIALNFSHLSEVWTWQYFHEFKYRIASSILLTQLGVLIYFLRNIWLKFQLKNSQ